MYRQGHIMRLHCLYGCVTFSVAPTSWYHNFHGSIPFPHTRLHYRQDYITVKMTLQSKLHSYSHDYITSLLHILSWITSFPRTIAQHPMLPKFNTKVWAISTKQYDRYPTLMAYNLLTNWKTDFPLLKMHVVCYTVVIHGVWHSSIDPKQHFVLKWSS